MRMPALLSIFIISVCLAPISAQAADFSLAATYGQSRDFWKTVQDVQDRTGNLTEIQNVVRDRYGRPDILYSTLEAAYAYPHDYDWFDTSATGYTIIGTKAEALAGGIISNPISPEIEAYANYAGIFSFGLHSKPELLIRGNYFSLRGLLGVGHEKRLYAQGAEFIEAIPVRTGTLLLGGAELNFLDRSIVGEDFFITTDMMLRGVYFYSSVDPAKSRPNEDFSFVAWRWKLQNEWLKEVDTFLSSSTRLGIITTLGQSPFPFLSLPITWDYQQKLKLFPGLGSVSGIGGIARFLTASALPNFSIYGGVFGGALGAGVDLQFGSLLLNGSTYGVENLFTPTKERTRLWSVSLGVTL